MILYFCTKKRPHGQAVKTPPSQGGNTSSILVGATKNRQVSTEACRFLLLHSYLFTFHSSLETCRLGNR